MRLFGKWRGHAIVAAIGIITVAISLLDVAQREMLMVEKTPITTETAFGVLTATHSDRRMGAITSYIQRRNFLITAMSCRILTNAEWEETKYLTVDLWPLSPDDGFQEELLTALTKQLQMRRLQREKDDK